jgi:hypothetical protein
MNLTILSLVLSLPISSAWAEESLKLYPGFVTKFRCEGRLMVSAIGNEDLVRLEPLPKELGCGVLLKPLLVVSKTINGTNLLLETSTGSIRRLIAIASASEKPRSQDLNYRAKGDQE